MAVDYPLQDIRVLDMSRVLAGPFAGRMLCDLGADVVKVEPPDGDVTRLWGAVIGGNPGYYHQQNAGKRNICVDLGLPAGREVILALAAKADVVIENFRPGVTRRLGVDYAALSAVNPRLVMLSISGFGQEGPESERGAYAAVIHAESGLIARQALQSGGRADIAVSLADMNAGLHGLVAVLSALWMRQRTGAGQHIDMAMIDAMLATDDMLHFALEDSWDTRVLPGDIWDTAAGPILISADFRHIWKLLRGQCGVEEPQPADGSLEARIAARREAARAYWRGLPNRAAVIATLDRLNLAWGEMRESRDAPQQPTVRHRGSIVQVDDRAGGTRPIPQSPYRFSGAASGVRGPAPWRGEHNAEVLREWLGMSDPGSWAEALLDPAETTGGSAWTSN
jgi:crotonobetainyl-CoA:carnitine CoA-transferase CaiB-like acyl-CoA transferase